MPGPHQALLDARSGEHARSPIGVLGRVPDLGRVRPSSGFFQSEWTSASSRRSKPLRRISLEMAVEAGVRGCAGELHLWRGGCRRMECARRYTLAPRTSPLRSGVSVRYGRTPATDSAASSGCFMACGQRIRPGWWSPARGRRRLLIARSKPHRAWLLALEARRVDVIGHLGIGHAA